MPIDWMRCAAAALLGVIAWCLAPVAHGQDPQEWRSDDIVAFENGHWFDGRRFVRRDTVFLVSGRIETRRQRATRRVDLAGAYVIPPLGDAHTHEFAGAFGFEDQRRRALAGGVFYAMTMTASARATTRIRDRFSGPHNVDVTTALGGITGPESHPAEIYEANALGYFSFDDQRVHQDEIRASRRMAGDAYHAVSTTEELEAAWGRLTQQGPDFVKVYLRSSERYAEGWGKWGPGGGLDPSLLPLVANLSRGAGLRLAVATSSVSDFRHAVSNGANIVTHLPCYQDTESIGPSNPYFDIPDDMECRLTIADARAARRAGTVSILIATEWERRRPDHYEQWEADNIALLMRARAPLAIGSNAYGRSLVPGLIAESQRNVIDRPTLLRIATMSSPRTIFPTRRIGCLTRGCEASFLVLARNPIEDFQALEQILFRVKDGELLSLAEIENSPLQQSADAP